MHITLTIQTHPLWQGSVRALPTPTGFNRPKEPSNCRLTFRHLRAGCGKTMCIYIYMYYHNIVVVISIEALTFCGAEDSTNVCCQKITIYNEQNKEKQKTKQQIKKKNRKQRE